MVLGRERVGVEADLLNLILRRQAAAAEAVDEDLRAGSGHAHQLLGHLVRIVGQRIDLVLRQRLREAVVAAIGGALILDDDGLLDRRQGQAQRGAVLAAAHVERRRDRTEAVGRGLHLVGAGIEVLEDRDAALVDRRRLLDAARVDDRDLRDDQRRLGLIEHRDPQRRPDAACPAPPAPPPAMRPTTSIASVSASFFTSESINRPSAIRN